MEDAYAKIPSQGMSLSYADDEAVEQITYE